MASASSSIQHTGAKRCVASNSSGCGLASSSGIFRQHMHATGLCTRSKHPSFTNPIVTQVKQLQSSGFVQKGSSWEQLRESLAKAFSFQERKRGLATACCHDPLFMCAVVTGTPVKRHLRFARMRFWRHPGGRPYTQMKWTHALRASACHP